MCMPVDNEQNRRVQPESFEVLQEVGRPANYDTEGPYKGSVQGDCEICEARIWVGPKIAGAKRINPDICLVCPLCAVGALAGRTVEMLTLSKKEFGD